MKAFYEKRCEWQVIEAPNGYHRFATQGEPIQWPPLCPTYISVQTARLTSPMITKPFLVLLLLSTAVFSAHSLTDGEKTALRAFLDMPTPNWALNGLDGTPLLN